MKKKLLLTGASGGIGFEILKSYLSKGYECICLISKKNTRLASLKKKYRNQIFVHIIDFSKKNWISKFESELRSIKKVDTLVNCAGINIIKKINDVNFQDYSKIFKINLESYYFITKILISKLKKSKSPRIVNISSIWSVISKEERSLYSATKGGINSLTRALSLELATHKILVNSISPGFIITNLTKKSLNKKETKKIQKTIPLNRFGKPSEIAELAFFLGSEKNSYITGQNIVCDGGFSIK